MRGTNTGWETSEYRKVSAAGSTHQASTSAIPHTGSPRRPRRTTSTISATTAATVSHISALVVKLW